MKKTTILKRLEGIAKLRLIAFRRFSLSFATPSLACLLIPALTCSAQIPTAEPDVETDRYLNPGIIVERGGEWVGSDHLLNLTGQIGVYSEIVTLPNVRLPFTERELDDMIKSEFQKAGISPGANVGKEGAPLPLFHLLVMVYPVNDQFVAYIDGRLFEKISVERAKLPPSAVLQGITWENQNLILADKTNIKEEVKETVQAVVEHFTARFKFFDRLPRR